MKGFSTLCFAPLFAALCFTCHPAWSTEQAVYGFGVVPQFEQRKLFRIWRPILDQLEQRTGFRFKLVGSSKIPEFERKLLAGVYDFAYMNPYHLLMAHDTQGYLPLVRDGERKLKGILVVAKESPIQSVKELDGKEVAFPSPNALGASLLMRAELSKFEGVEVAPNYVQTHSSVYLHVALGLNPAGGGVASTLRSQEPEIRNKLRILYQTQTVNPHPIGAHPRVPDAHRIKVQQALLEMAQTKNGALLLSRIPMRETTVADLEDYTPLRALGLEEFYIRGNSSNQPQARQEFDLNGICSVIFQGKAPNHR
jgi:phosphonate transport system substrate-binding protein